MKPGFSFRLLFLLAFSFTFQWAGLQVVFGQGINSPRVTFPVFSDQSKPLTELVGTASEHKENRRLERAEKEIWNYFVKLNRKSGTRHRTLGNSVQQNFGTDRIDTVYPSFEGASNIQFVLPPDTDGDVGVDHYVQLTNYSMTVFLKTGEVVLGPVNASILWSGIPFASNFGDGIVLFDEQSGRWIIETLCFPNFPSGPYYVLIAVSQSEDPTGSWYRWVYESEDMIDYPKMGVWRNDYLLSFNRFRNQIVFQGVAAAAFDRLAMVAGSLSPAMVTFSLNSSSNVISILPADCDGVAPPEGAAAYFSYLDSGSLGIYEMKTNWEYPALSTFGNLLKLNVDPYTPYFDGIPQKGTPIHLHAVSDRLMCQLKYRRFADHQSMVVNHTINFNNRAGIRWYELRRNVGNWYVYQQSTFSPDSNSRWMGSVALDSAGNIALGYSVSGTSLYPSIRFTGRMKNDPPGIMTIGESSLEEGGGAQTSPALSYSRWGDYSAMSVDPVNPHIFWYTQEYYPETDDNDWHTRIGSFSFARILDINAVAEPKTICPGQSVQLDVEVSGGDSTIDYHWISKPAGFVSEEKSPVASPNSPTIYFVTVTSGAWSKTDSVMIDILPPPEVDAGPDRTLCKNVEEIQLYGTAVNYSVSKWITTGDGNFEDPDEISTRYFPGTADHQSPATLTLTAYPPFSCPVVSDNLLLIPDTCISVPTQENLISGSFFVPNPAKDQIFLLDIPGAKRVEIYGLQGQLVFFMNFPVVDHNEVVVDLSDKPRGLYFVRLFVNNAFKTAKLVLE